MLEVYYEYSFVLVKKEGVQLCLVDLSISHCVVLYFTERVFCTCCFLLVEKKCSHVLQYHIHSLVCFYL